MGSRTLVLAAGSALDASPADLIDAAAGAGFEAVGVRLDPATATAPALDRLRRRATDLGVAIHDVEVHRVPADGTADPTWLVDAAARLGAGWVLVVSDHPDLGSTVDAVGAVVTQAAELGLGVGLEYMAWTTPSTPADGLHVAQATGARVVVDVLHHVRVGARAHDLASLTAAGVVGWVQLCDAPAAAPVDLLHEARHGRRIPGQGDLPLADLLAVAPHDVAVSVEVQSDELVRMVAVHERARLLHDAATAVLSHRG